MTKLIGILPERGQDVHGSGAYGAPRGINRKHVGVDFECTLGTEILAVSSGTITKIGYPYSQRSPKAEWSLQRRKKFLAKKALRYVQVTDNNGYDVRYSYATTHFKKGDVVGKDEVVCTVQDLKTIYLDITPHLHFEVKRKRKIVDPHEYLASLGE